MGEVTSDGDCDCCGRDCPIGMRIITGVLAGGVMGFIVGGVPWLLYGICAGLIIGGAADLYAYWDRHRW